MIQICPKGFYRDVRVVAGICEMAGSNWSWENCGGCPCYEGKWRAPGLSKSKRDQAFIDLAKREEEFKL